MDGVTWNHVLDQHVEMSEYLAETMAAIKAPDHREPDPERDASASSAKEVPSAGFGSVTEFSGSADRVATAFPQSDDPRQGGWRR